MIVTHLPTSRRNLSPGWLALALLLVLLGLIVGELSSSSMQGTQSGGDVARPSGDVTRQIPSDCQLPCADHGKTAHAITP
jgi:hypothetical protein